MVTKPTWKPHTEPGKLSAKDRKELPDSVFAFPKQRKEPLTDASHVQNALALILGEIRDSFHQVLCA